MHEVWESSNSLALLELGTQNASFETRVLKVGTRSKRTQNVFKTQPKRIQNALKPHSQNALLPSFSESIQKSSRHTGRGPRRSCPKIVGGSLPTEWRLVRPQNLIKELSKHSQNEFTTYSKRTLCRSPKQAKMHSKTRVSKRRNSKTRVLNRNASFESTKPVRRLVLQLHMCMLEAQSCTLST